MQQAIKDFDLVVVIGYFRSACPILSVLKYLSPTYRIGLVFQPLNEEIQYKTGCSQKVFEEICLDAGGIRVELGLPVKTRLLLVQQHTYERYFIDEVLENVRTEEILGMLSLASMGLEYLDNFIEQFGITKLTLPDKGLANFLISNRRANDRFKVFEIYEVGLPYKSYPIFTDFSADWIVAAPTLFSFYSEEGKHRFLRDVLKLLYKIQDSDVVVYKPHNGNSRDYFSPKGYAFVATFLNFFPYITEFLELCSPSLPTFIRKHLAKVVTALLFRKVMRRVIPMRKMTKFYEMSIEAFLPHVRKGVIGGESNTMWGVSFFGLDYFNCVRPNERISGSSQLTARSGEGLLELNLKYFGLPYCHGDFAKDNAGARHLVDSSHSLNLVDLILSKLQG